MKTLKGDKIQVNATGSWHYIVKVNVQNVYFLLIVNGQSVTIYQFGVICFVSGIFSSWVTQGLHT